jgi:transcriptional regulator HilA, main transcriptional regulator of SPI1
VSAPVRFRFAEFVLSPRQRILSRNGEALALIPKYFDLLLLLISRRQEAVSKQTIFEHVWTDVIVSDGALSQAVRTLRRTLGDDSREPRFIRTVSRHGYQFVWPTVLEEPDDGLIAARPAAPNTDDQTLDALVDRLIAASGSSELHDEARDLAERLHARGTDSALQRIVARPGHAPALAMMRDARWNVPGAGPVALLGDREAVRAIAGVMKLRVSAVRHTIASRCAGAAASGALGGVLAGACGGIALMLSPTSTARPPAVVALAAIGAVAGTIGAGGVGAGLAAAEALARSRRGLALAACGAAAGAIVAAAADLLLRVLLESLFGLHLYDGGGAAIDGGLVGAAAGIGYALATSQPPGGGIAAPHGLRRAITILTVGLCCAAATTVLSLAARPLVGGLVHEIARASRNAQLVLAPLGHLIGEPGFGPVTRALLSAFEGLTFGCSLAWGFTRRPVRKNG